MSDTSGTAVEVGTREPRELAERASEIVSTDDLLRLAVSKAEGTPGIEIVERIVALKEREQALAAERAMKRALRAFQEDCPAIPRTATAEVKKNGVKQYTYHYAPLEKIVDLIGPVLSKHGLSFTHDSEITGQNGIAVTCTLHHEDGATSTATFRGPMDDSGGKNEIQKVASARSYGRRYSLIDVLGLTTGGEDDDGHAAGGTSDDSAIDPARVNELETMIRETGSNKAKFLKILQVDTLAELKAGEFEVAKKLLLAKKEGGGS